MKRISESIPTFAPARRGNKLSLLDAIVRALWKGNSDRVWPERSFPEIRSIASAMLGYDVPSASIRCYIYIRSDLFSRVNKERNPRWRLSAKAKSWQSR